jgi:hypothetical protein
MSGNSEINTTAEIWMLVEKMGKDASFKVVLSALRQKFPDHEFSADFANQVFQGVRKQLGFTQ